MKTIEGASIQPLGGRYAHLPEMPERPRPNATNQPHFIQRSIGLAEEPIGGRD